MHKFFVWVIGALIVLTQQAAALPVIPGATGFGIETPAGRGGQIIRVTNLNSSGSGALKACVDATGPRICVFEVAGNIKLTGNMNIENSNITIAGQTAPHPGITIIGAALKIHASDVLIQHIAVRPGDSPDGPSPGLRDAMVVGAASGKFGTIKNVVIDHCSFSWSVDELFSTSYGYWDNLTIRNSVFAFPLHDSIHPQTSPPGDGNGHSMGMLLGEGTGKVDISSSLFAHAMGRNPLSRAGGFVFRNNVVYNHRNAGTQLQGGGGYVSRNDIVGNVYIEGAESKGYAPVTIGQFNSMVSGSRVYEAGNLRVRSDGSSTSNVVDTSGSSSYMSSTPLFPSLSSQVASVNGGAFVNDLLTNVGRRPASRDFNDVDSRAVRETINRTGRAINCVEDDGSARCDANAGGWPANSNARITLNIPSNPNGDSDGDGYTNLEEWLHARAAEVEHGDGALALPPPPQPLPPVISAL